MSRLICWLRTIKYTAIDNPLGLISFGAYTSGHKYVELCDNKDIHVLKCIKCGSVSTAFHFNPDERIKEILAESPELIKEATHED